jgi:surface protein
MWECISRRIPHDQEENKIRERASHPINFMLPFPVKALLDSPYLTEEEQKVFQILEKAAFICMSKDPLSRPTATCLLQYLHDYRSFNCDCQHLSKWTELDTDIENSLNENDCGVCVESSEQMEVINHLTLVRHFNSIKQRAVPKCKSVTIIVFFVIIILAVAGIVFKLVKRSDLQTFSPMKSPSLVPTFYPTIAPKEYVTYAPTVLPTYFPISVQPSFPTQSSNYSCFQTHEVLKESIIAYLQGDSNVREEYGNTIGTWCVQYITDFSRLFVNSSRTEDFCCDDLYTSFNESLSSWNTSAATNMSSMFRGAASFNQNLSLWDVSSVRDMSNMFRGADEFNQDLSSWDVSSVKTMSGMFMWANGFNQDISSWDVSSVTDMSSMFSGASSFNRSLTSWNVASVMDMSNMFRLGSSSIQNLSLWNVSSVRNMSGMFLS